MKQVMKQVMKQAMKSKNYDNLAIAASGPEFS